MVRRLAVLVRELGPNRYFGALWLSQLLSLTAFNMVNFTLLLRVFELTNSSVAVSLFVLSFGVPSLLFGAIAGVFADRWDRRRVLITTNLLRALLVLAYLPALSHLPIIFLTTFAVATVTQFFTPAEGALIPELVERKRLVAANAVFITTMFISFVLGYGLAGPLAATWGDQLPIQLAAVMFAAATIACFLLPSTSRRGTAVSLRTAYRQVGRQLVEGLRFARRQPPIRYALAQLTFIWSTVGVVMVVVPAYTAEVLGLNLREVSRLIILPIGVGMLAGGYLLHCMRGRYRLAPVFSVALLVTGLAVVALGEVRQLADWLISAGLAVSEDPTVMQQFITSVSATLIGICVAIVMIGSQTVIHEQTDPHIRGRIFGVLGMCVNAANTIPVLVVGALTDILHVSLMVTMVGLALVVWSATCSRMQGASRVDTAHVRSLD